MKKVFLVISIFFVVLLCRRIDGSELQNAVDQAAGTAIPVDLVSLIDDLVGIEHVRLIKKNEERPLPLPSFGCIVLSIAQNAEHILGHQIGIYDETGQYKGFAQHTCLYLNKGSMDLGGVILDAKMQGDMLYVLQDQQLSLIDCSLDRLSPLENINIDPRNFPKHLSIENISKRTDRIIIKNPSKKPVVVYEATKETLLDREKRHKRELDARIRRRRTVTFASLAAAATAVWMYSKLIASWWKK